MHTRSLPCLCLLTHIPCYWYMTAGPPHARHHAPYKPRSPTTTDSYVLLWFLGCGNRPASFILALMCTYWFTSVSFVYICVLCLCRSLFDCIVFATFILSYCFCEFVVVLGLCFNVFMCGVCRSALLLRLYVLHLLFRVRFLLRCCRL